MKKLIVVVFLLISTFVFSSETKKKNGHTLLDNLKFDKYSANNEIEKNEKFYRTDRALKIIHPIFGAIASAGFLALDGIGIALLYGVFSNQNYNWYESLKIAHLAVAVSAMTSFATLVTLGYVKAGLKAKAGFKLNRAHLVSSFISVGFYVLELAATVLTGIFFAKNMDGKEWVALSHGIICGLTTVALSVSVITVFL